MRTLFLSAKAIPVAASLVAHVALAVVVGGHGAADRGTVAAGPTEIAIEIESAPAPQKTPEPEAPREPAPTSPAHAHAHAHASHTHAYPVAPDHDAHPHDPSLVHAPLGAPAADDHDHDDAPPVALAPAAEPVRFTLTATHVGTTAHAAATPSGSGTGGGGNDVSAPLGESSVSTGARLVATAPALYPAAARSAEIEADVPVEIVVARDGSVESAAPVGRASGFGLDDAAARTVRAYRFTPAMKDGHPVRVRMRWMVQFRLR